jgi:cation diffusion facilitator CzcD-associated flavoprotein CzcO
MRRILKSAEPGTRIAIPGKLDHFLNLYGSFVGENLRTLWFWFCLLCPLLTNTYRCACDVPSHCYTWSFEPKTDWSATYASSKEIQQYFSDFATRHDLYKHIKLRQEVNDAVWNSTSAKWEIKVLNAETGEIQADSAHILINAGGILNAWRYPPIPGIKDYQGALVHSAAWDPNLSLEGKTVGLIGNGSSGIQILPAIKNAAKSLITFIREPTWVSPPIGQGFKAYTLEDKARFAADPEYHLQIRREIESDMNKRFGLFHTGSTDQQETKAYMLMQMKEKLKNPGLEKVLIPKWSVGCRRITPGTDYLESLSAPNVKVVYGEIDSITEKGCVVEGQEHEVDVLICATGFDTVSSKFCKSHYAKLTMKCTKPRPSNHDFHSLDPQARS